MTTLHVKDFGTVADALANDAPAITKALAAAVASGPGTTLVFENKTYRLDHNPKVFYHFSLKGVKGLTLEGNGALLLNHPKNSLLDMDECSDITLSGFIIDHHPLPFTQGKVRDVDIEKGSFTLEIDKDYPHPLNNEWVKKKLRW